MTKYYIHNVPKPRDILAVTGGYIVGAHRLRGTPPTVVNYISFGDKLELMEDSVWVNIYRELTEEEHFLYFI